MNEHALRDVEKATAQKRHLPLLKKVPVQVFTKAESRAFFKANATDRDPVVVEEGHRLQDVVAHRIGLLSPKIRLSSLFAKAMAQNAAGVYRPKSAALYIVSDIYPGLLRVPLLGFSIVTGVDWANEHILSHELMHGIQDQHFGLDTLLPSAAYAENEDQALAIKSILESEANMVANAISLGIDLDQTVSRSLLLSYLSLLADLNVWLTRLNTPHLPSFYAKMFTEQYTIALPYLLAVTSRNGLAGLDDAYRSSLPLSTEQLLHPEKCFADSLDEPAIPVRIQNDQGLDIGPSFGPSDDDKSIGKSPAFALIETNVFGEFLWRILFEEHHSRRVASSSAAGWDGDRYAVYEEQLSEPKNSGGVGQVVDEGHAAGKNQKNVKVGINLLEDEAVLPAPRRRNVLLWRIVLDDEAEAEEFASAVEVLLAENAAALGESSTRDMEMNAKKIYAVDVKLTLPISKEGDLHDTPVESFALVRDGKFVVVVMGSHPNRLKDWLRFGLAHRETEEAVRRIAKPVTRSMVARVDKKSTSDVAAFRLHMPHRHASYRIETGVHIQNLREAFPLLQEGQTDAFVERLSLLPTGNAQFRIGVRQFLSASLPMTLSLDVSSVLQTKGKMQPKHGPLQTVLTIGVRELALAKNGDDLVLLTHLGFTFTQRIRLISGFSWVGQLGAEGVLYSDPNFDSPIRLSFSTGFLLSPLEALPSSWPFAPDRVLFSPAISVQSSLKLLEHWRSSKAQHELTFGSALSQDFYALPLVEWMLFDGFYLTGTAQAVLDTTTWDLIGGKALLGIQLKL
ncbi:MAG: hypothetical protein GY822_31760 [Deltaproteobacteria bacterium]|nr:hypothetical protein [Deltaproteobacteria bacterium]